MTRKAQVGIQFHPQHCTMAELRDAWMGADALGVDSIFAWDHFFPLYGADDNGAETFGDLHGDHFEGMSILAAMAATTTNANVGLMVSCNSYRNPELHTDMHRTIDHISGGRVIMGVGSGWFEPDYTEYGYDFGTAIGRLHQLRDDLPRMADRRSKLKPGPMGKMPLLIGGAGEKVTLKLVAQFADAWNTFGPPDSYKAKNDILNQHCADVGRNPADIDRTVCVGAEDLERFDEYLDAGATHLIMMSSVGFPGAARTGFDLGNLEKLLAWAEG